MNRHLPILLSSLLAIATSASAEEPVAKLTATSPNSPAEPLAKQMSVAKAVDFIDRASLHWQRSRKCVTCHTNGAYLMALVQCRCDRASTINAPTVCLLYTSDAADE